MNALVPLPVVMPLAGAALTLLLPRWPRVQRTISVVVLAATLAVSAVLLWAIGAFCSVAARRANATEALPILP